MHKIDSWSALCAGAAAFTGGLLAAHSPNANLVTMVALIVLFAGAGFALAQPILQVAKYVLLCIVMYVAFIVYKGQLPKPPAGGNLPDWLPGLRVPADGAEDDDEPSKASDADGDDRRGDAHAD